MINVHPFTPTGARAAEWAAELGDLPSTGSGTPWLLAGDFNATLDHAVLRGVLDRGYRDAGAVTGNGLEPTLAQQPAAAAIDRDRPRPRRRAARHRGLRGRGPPRHRPPSDLRDGLFPSMSASR